MEGTDVQRAPGGRRIDDQRGGVERVTIVVGGQHRRPVRVDQLQGCIAVAKQIERLDCIGRAAGRLEREDVGIGLPHQIEVDVGEIGLMVKRRAGEDGDGLVDGIVRLETVGIVFHFDFVEDRHHLRMVAECESRREPAVPEILQADVHRGRQVPRHHRPVGARHVLQHVERLLDTGTLVGRGRSVEQIPERRVDRRLARRPGADEGQLRLHVEVELQISRPRLSGRANIGAAVCEIEMAAHRQSPGRRVPLVERQHDVLVTIAQAVGTARTVAGRKIMNDVVPHLVQQHGVVVPRVVRLGDGVVAEARQIRIAGVEEDQQQGPGPRCLQRLQVLDPESRSVQQIERFASHTRNGSNRPDEQVGVRVVVRESLGSHRPDRSGLIPGSHVDRDRSTGLAPRQATDVDVLDPGLQDGEEEVAVRIRDPRTDDFRSGDDLDVGEPDRQLGLNAGEPAGVEFAVDVGEAPGHLVVAEGGSRHRRNARSKQQKRGDAPHGATSSPGTPITSYAPR